jgi:alkylhydroperoxidase family enzyme
VLAWKDEPVRAALADWRTAPIDERLRAMLGFLEKLTLTPERIGPEDVAPLRAVGLTDQAIREAVYVCFLFNVMDRLADAFGFTLPTPESRGRAAKFLYRLGYGGASVPG